MGGFVWRLESCFGRCFEFLLLVSVSVAQATSYTTGRDDKQAKHDLAASWLLANGRKRKWNTNWFAQPKPLAARSALWADHSGWLSPARLTRNDIFVLQRPRSGLEQWENGKIWYYFCNLPALVIRLWFWAITWSVGQRPPGLGPLPNDFVLIALFNTVK